MAPGPFQHCSLKGELEKRMASNVRINNALVDGEL